MARNPLATDPDTEHRIRERAYHLWEADGRPHGRDVEFWERARELIGMEDSAGAGLLPNPQTHPDSPAETGVEEAEIQQNLGEFPGPLTDQGEEQQMPAAVKRQPRSAAAKAPKAATSHNAVAVKATGAETSGPTGEAAPPAKRRAPAKPKKA
ncbi:MAG: DUF2934 domain-containing protein [Acetobacteraceae bacterium]|nr:DUF2934 domain-containing protein [Pseudomonadota bacterium]